MPRLLGIFAHPDDESFGPGGTLARYARQGVDVHVCIVTDGAVGVVDEALLAASGCDTLADLRSLELECAARVLGATLHTLGYRDSGMSGADANSHPDCLLQADMDVVANDVAVLIRDVRPDVVIAHDATGGYFHPDHIKVSQAVDRAFELLEGDVAQPARLYHAVIPRSQLVWLVRALRLFHFLRLSRTDPTRFGDNNDIDLTHLGVPAGDIHVRLDVGEFAGVRAEASACHRSQGGGGMPGWLPGFLVRRLMRYDYYTQAWPRSARSHLDLFEQIV